MMAETVPIPCLGCDKKLNMPKGLVHMAEREGDKYVAFCSRACNLKFIQRKGQEGQDANLKKMLERYR